MLQSKLELMGDVGRLRLALGFGGGILLLTLAFRSHSFGTVLVQQFEDVRCLVLADGLGELVNGWWDLQALVENGTLTLDAHVLGPAHEAAKIAAGGTDGAANVVGARAGGEERVGLGRGGGLGGGFALGLAGSGFLGCHGGVLVLRWCLFFLIE